MQRSARLGFTVVLSALAACGVDSAPTQPGQLSPAAARSASRNGETFALTSSAFQNGATMPQAYYCPQWGGQNVAPALSWSGAPQNTKALAIVMDDPDAVPAPTTFTHWIAWDISKKATEMPASSEFTHGANDLYYYKDVFGLPPEVYLNYFGPCPPLGTGVHHYTFHLYALSDKHIDLAAGSTRAAFYSAINGKVIAEATLIGLVDSGTP